MEYREFDLFRRAQAPRVRAPNIYPGSVHSGQQVSVNASTKTRPALESTLPTHQPNTYTTTASPTSPSQTVLDRQNPIRTSHLVTGHTRLNRINSSSSIEFYTIEHGADIQQDTDLHHKLHNSRDNTGLDLRQSSPDVDIIIVELPQAQSYGQAANQLGSQPITDSGTAAGDVLGPSVEWREAQQQQQQQYEVHSNAAYSAMQLSQQCSMLSSKTAASQFASQPVSHPSSQDASTCMGSNNQAQKQGRQAPVIVPERVRPPHVGGVTRDIGAFSNDRPQSSIGFSSQLGNKITFPGKSTDLAGRAGSTFMGKPRQINGGPTAMNARSSAPISGSTMHSKTKRMQEIELAHEFLEKYKDATTGGSIPLERGEGLEILNNVIALTRSCGWK